MTAFTALYDEVVPDVPGAPLPLVLNAIRNAAIEFCERSCVLVETPTPVDAVALTPSYALAPSTGMSVVQPITVWYNGKRLTYKTPEELDELYDNWPAKFGLPYYYTQEIPGTIILVPMPDTALTAGITAKIAVKPGLAATTIIDWLFEKYYMVLAHGAKWKIKEIVGKPWSDPKGAMYHKTMFEEGITAPVVPSMMVTAPSEI